MDVHYRKNEKPLKFIAELSKGDWCESKECYKFSMSTPLKLLCENENEVTLLDTYRLFVSKELYEELEQGDHDPAAYYGDYYVTVYVDLFVAVMSHNAETIGYYFKLLKFESYQ